MNMHEKLAIAKTSVTAGQPAVTEFDDNDTDRAGKNVTKSDLVVRLMTRFPPLSARDTDYAVRLILSAMVSALKQKKRIEIRGFGSFTLTYRPARLGRNPKSGEQVNIPCKWVPHFKAGKEMRERVDKTP